jgi:hypothetical protein
MRPTTRAALLALFAVLAALAVFPAASLATSTAPNSFSWTKVYDGTTGGWAGRAGLQAVQTGGNLYVMGGRTPAPSQFDPFASILWNDVWRSADKGATWRPIGTAPWAPRAYFQAVSKDGVMYVLGGQDQVSGQPSTFYNDVWASRDGRSWTRLTEHAPWQARAGLSAVVKDGWIYVLGGSNGDDVAIGGSGRVLFDDVWRSRDGRSWQRVTANAPWAARAGGALVVKDGYLYLLGGEDGFLCTVGAGGLQCPYFNDVWRSRNGADWKQLTPSASWTARPGLQSQVLGDTIVVFGGFGWPALSDPAQPPGPGNPFLPGHPTDQWASRDGAKWTRLAGSPWNAAGPADIKYDFDSLVVRSGLFGLRQSILTFGGDREISFVNPDPGAVDSDVWRATPRFWVW